MLVWNFFYLRQNAQTCEIMCSLYKENIMKKIVILFLGLVSLLAGKVEVQATDVKVTDSLGTELVFEQTPERVVVLGYSEYDTLKALGLEELVVGAP